MTEPDRHVLAVSDRSDVARPATGPGSATAVPDLAANATRLIGPARAAALTRAVATGAPLSNRGVGRMLSRIWDRDPDYWYDDVNPRGYDTDTQPAGPVATTTTAGPVASVPAAVASTGGTPFREEILKLANQIDAKGVTETAPVVKEGVKVPGTGGIGKWVDQGQLDANRKLMGSGYTSCGTLLGNIWVWAKAAALKKHPNLKIDLNKQQFEMDQSTIPGSWNLASPGMAARPRPGDAYFLQFVDTRKQSHITTLKSITKVDADKEIWVSADGGQREGQGLPDKVAERTRTYVPSTNLILGGENGDKDPRWLYGWTDVDTRCT